MTVAVVGKIQEINSIEKADRLESAIVVCGKAGRWVGVVQKGEFAAGDLVNVFLQDSLLPPDERWAFMEKSHWRVRMSRFRGAPSECLIVPPYVIGEVGQDIAEDLGITKYEKLIPASMGGDILGNFPSFIPKTDEPNFQAVPERVQSLIGYPYYASTKYDGTSCTVFVNNGTLGVCSRNWEMKPGNTVYWEMFKKYNLQSLVTLGDYAVQFEIIGPSIQGNPVGLKDREIRVFNVVAYTEHIYMDFDTLKWLCYTFQLPMVETLGISTWEFTDDEAIRKFAEGIYPNGSPREGIVIRTPCASNFEDRLSFKVINLNYKD